MMKLVTVSCLACALMLASVAAAQDLKIPNDVQMETLVVDCPVTGYTEYSITENLALDTDVEYMLGPLATNAGAMIQDVRLDLDITQTWVGDLVAELFYDVDCDGTPDIGPVSALCRAQLDACPFPDGCCGCSGDIDGVYRFGDDAIAPLGEFDCPTTIPPGCFLPAVESPTGFVVFNDLGTGGCFWLRIGDGAAGDDTFLRGWTAWVLQGGTTPVEPATWGQVKSTYGD